METDPKAATPAPVKPKRKQVKAACVNCRQACRGCDDGRPCKRCIKRGIQDTCEDAPRRQRSSTAAAKLRSGVAKAFQAVRQLAIAPRPSNKEAASPSSSSLPSYTTTPRSSFQTPRTSFQFSSSPRSSFQYSSPHAEDVRALFQQCTISDVMTNSPTIGAKQLPTLEPPPKTHSPVASAVAHGAFSVHRTTSDEKLIAKFEGGRRSSEYRPSPLIMAIGAHHAEPGNMSTGHLPVVPGVYPRQSMDSTPEVYGPNSGGKRLSCSAIDSLHQMKRPHWMETGDLPLPMPPFQLPTPMEHHSTGSTSGRSSYELPNSSWMGMDHGMKPPTGPPFTPPSYAISSAYKLPHEAVQEEEHENLVN